MCGADTGKLGKGSKGSGQGTNIEATNTLLYMTLAKQKEKAVAERIAKP